jgi:hypothetical protein
MGAYMRPALLCATLAVGLRKPTISPTAPTLPRIFPRPALKRIPRPAILLRFSLSPLVIAPATDFVRRLRPSFVSQGPTLLCLQPVYCSAHPRPCLASLALTRRDLTFSHIRPPPRNPPIGSTFNPQPTCQSERWATTLRSRPI